LLAEASSKNKYEYQVTAAKACDLVAEIRSALSCLETAVRVVMRIRQLCAAWRAASFGVNETFAVADMAAANFRNSLDQESCH
jgi:hypothetical protein